MTAFSKTDIPCDCGWLSQAINDSRSSIFYDARQNCICCGTEDGCFILYHCPFCGGAFPDSTKPMWIPIIPPGEFDRLQEMIQNLHDAEGILHRLGVPDYDEMSYSFGNVNGILQMDKPTAPIRNIEYYQLSEFLNVEFYISEDNHLTKRLTIKPLSARTLTDDEQVHNR